MNDTARNWRRMLPVPAGLVEAVRTSRATLSDYLSRAFEASFGGSPREVVYESFPEGLFAGLVIDGKLATEHNVWAVMIATALRDAGLNVNVFVRAASELEEAEGEHERVEAEVRARIRNRRKRA